MSSASVEIDTVPGAGEWPPRAVTTKVTVPATSANLGPGFDSLGLALDLRDEVTVAASWRGVGSSATTACHVVGHGAGTVPTDDAHLIAATIRRALNELAPGLEQPDLALTCVNAIPHGKGLGSSAAAIVAGLAAAWELATGAARLDPGRRVEWLIRRSAAIEGHGDNAAAAVLGGAIVSWCDDTGFRAVGLDVDNGLGLVTAVPDAVLATHEARAILPDMVSRADAVFTGARTVVLAEALRGRRQLLMAGTEDRLHQDARASAMPATLDLVRRLRGHGMAAVVSGAGPSVLVLGAKAKDVGALVDDDWHVDDRILGQGVDVAAVAPVG